jgi:glycosyltransferase involved in cell wall biosynthesis
MTQCTEPLPTRLLSRSDVTTTIGICTLNRVDYLREAIAEALRQIEGVRNARLVVIDNGSTDGTLPYLQALAASEPRVSFHVEPRRGLYFARAALADRTSSDYLILLDDDAIPQAGTFERLIAALEADERAGAVGCAVDPLWEAPRPAWLHDRFLPPLCIHQEVPKIDCRYPCYPPGICLAIRVNACLRTYAGQERRSGYPLERSGTTYKGNYKLLGGGDTDLCEIYARNGFRVFWSSTARVSHRVPADRLKLDWIYRKFEGDGHTAIRLLRLGGRSPVGRHSAKMLSAFPALLMLKILLGIAGSSKLLLVTAYYRKSLAAWRELLFGPRIAPVPYVCSTAAPQETGT